MQLQRRPMQCTVVLQGDVSSLPLLGGGRCIHHCMACPASAPAAPALPAAPHLRALRALGPRLVIVLAHQADSRAGAGRRSRLSGRRRLGGRNRRLRLGHRRSRRCGAVAAKQRVGQRRGGHVGQAGRIQRAGARLLPAGRARRGRAAGDSRQSTWRQLRQWRRPNKGHTQPMQRPSTPQQPALRT